MKNSKHQNAIRAVFISRDNDVIPFVNLFVQLIQITSNVIFHCRFCCCWNPGNGNLIKIITTSRTGMKCSSALCKERTSKRSQYIQVSCHLPARLFQNAPQHKYDNNPHIRSHNCKKLAWEQIQVLARELLNLCCVTMKQGGKALSFLTQ